MKNLMKMIVIAAMTVLLLCAAMSIAEADEKIYTSPVFKLPADKITDWAASQPDEEPEAEPDESGSETEPETPAISGGGESKGSEPEEGGETGASASERRVRIFSSQGAVVTEGEIIYLSSTLEGFDGLEVTFQWQVDRGDGAGWVDVEGANRSRHMFVASKETIGYSWRLIVNIVE